MTRNYHPTLILAAGQSSRMHHRDKLLEPVHGTPLLRRIARIACDVSDDVHVALHHNADNRLALLEDLPITPLLTPEAAEGMGGTMRAGVAQLPDCDAFLLLLSDLPDLTADDLRAVITARETHPDNLIWRGATTTGKPGHPILFDAALRPQFETLQGDTGGEPLVNPLKDQTHLVRFDSDRARLDLDTPEDWANWRKINR